MRKFEKNLVEMWENIGYTVYSSGWPDYLLVRGTDVKAVEVKSSGDKMRGNQEAVLSALMMAGISTRVMFEEKDAQEKHYQESPIYRVLGKVPEYTWPNGVIDQLRKSDRSFDGVGIA